MKQTPEDLLVTAQKTAMSLTAGAWPAFLRTAAWNFKYEFISQLLIFARKPDATACAPHDLWTSEQFRRQPRKGTGIALLANNGPEPNVRYVFDISDTMAKNEARSPVNPVWEVTEAKEPAVRKALSAAFLPREQQTQSYLTAEQSVFYRSVASHIVALHFGKLLNALNEAHHTCALKDMNEAETTQLFRSLLTESVSAMLQFRCGLIPEVNEQILAQAKLFNSPEAISVLGRAAQEMAKIGLLEVSHAVHAWDTRHKNEIQQSLKTIRREEDPFGISEDDVMRAIIVGPPLEGGKYRLQLAAEDPNCTSERFETLLQNEYGTGERAFLLSSGISGTLSWGPQGLKIGRNGLREGVDLTLTWKIASERLRALVRANLYLSDCEKHNMKGWIATQNTIFERKITGEAMSAALNTLLPARQDLPKYQELIRAYIYDNSDAARQTLINLMQDLTTSVRARRDPEVLSSLCSITDALAGRGEIPTQNNSVQIPSPNNPEPSRDGISGQSASIFRRNANALYSANFNNNASIVCAPDAIKRIPFAGNSGEASGFTPVPEPQIPSVLSHSDPCFEPVETGSSVCAGNHPKEPLIDHPELRAKELHRLDRSDKVALADLLYHYTTYRSTFNHHAPPLCEHDAACRKEDFAVMDELLVSPSVEENLAHLRLARTILTRWFLPFEDIRPEILSEQESLLAAAEQVLSDPPEQTENLSRIHPHNHAQDYAHIHVDNYEDTQPVPIVPVAVDEIAGDSLWDYAVDENCRSEGKAVPPLNDRIRNAQTRSVPPPERTPEYAVSRN